MATISLAKAHSLYVHVLSHICSGDRGNFTLGLEGDQVKQVFLVFAFTETTEMAEAGILFNCILYLYCQ